MKSMTIQLGRAVTRLSEKLVKKLQDKEYRDEYMDEQIRTWIARQIRVLREQRGWSQTQFAQVCGKPQSVISRLEDPDYGKISLQTLLDLRRAFDVGLVVRFTDYGSAVNEHRDLARGAMEVASFDFSQIVPEVERPGTTARMTDRRAERMIEMMQALTPFARAADFYETAPDERAVIVTPESKVTVRDLRAARDALID